MRYATPLAATADGAARDRDVSVRMPPALEPVTVTTTPEAEAESLFFFDDFAGIDSLDTHVPDLGSSYTPDGGSLVNMYLDGVGRMIWSGQGNPVAKSTFGDTPRVPWTLEAKFKCHALGTEAAFLEMEALDADSNNAMVRVHVAWDGSAWELNFYIVTIGGFPLYQFEGADVTDHIQRGVDTILSIAVERNRTSVLLNDTAVVSTTDVPDAIPNTLRFTANTEGGALTVITLDYIKGINEP